MKTSSLSISLVTGPGSSLQKMMLASLLIAVLFASFPAADVYAASGTASDLRAEWKDKIQHVRSEGFFYQRVRVYPADFEDLDELARANDLLNQYGVAYRAAQTLIFNHAGFDEKGAVLNETQADETIKDVAENLRIMRSIRKKLDEMEGEYRLLPMSAVTAPPAQ